jgi:hypothetical protein
MAFFILATSLFHVRGAVEPSSKNVRDTTPDCGEPNEGLMKEVEEGLEVGPIVLLLEFEKVPPRDRLGKNPLLIESMEVAGDIPSESIDRRLEVIS